MVNLKHKEVYVQVAGLLAAFVAAAVLSEDYVGDSHTVAGVLLGEPINKSIQNETTINFTYYPVVNNGSIHHVELWTNETGTWTNVANNTTAVVNASYNYIEYTISTW